MLPPSITDRPSQNLEPVADKRLQDMQARLLERAMEEVGLYAQETALHQQIVNRWDYRPSWNQRSLDTPFGVGLQSRIWDRQEGRNAPLVETEQDLWIMQGTARYLEDTLCPAHAIKNALTSYVVGTGFQFDVRCKRGRRKKLGNADAKLARVQDFVDRFLDVNDFYGGYSPEPLGAEMFWRAHRAGEVINLLGTENRGATVKWRIIDERQLAEPTSDLNELLPRMPVASNVKWGIHKADHDCREVFGYAIFHDENDWYYYPENYVCHFRQNVDSGVARGLSDYYPAIEWLNLQPRLLRNTGEGAREQAAIGYVVEMAIANAATTMSMQTANGGVQITRGAGSGDETYFQRYRPPGAPLYVPKGQQYKEGPMGSDRGMAFIEVSNALLRMVGSRFCLSEGQISGNDSNNNFASSVTAGSRFWAYARYMQTGLGHRYCAVIWKALKLAYDWGRFPEFESWEELEYAIEIVPTPPKIETHNRAEEEEIQLQRLQAGAITKEEYKAAVGLPRDMDDSEEATAPTLGESAGASLVGLGEKVTQGAISPEFAVQAAVMTLGLTLEQAKSLFSSIQPGGGEAGEPAGGEMSGLSRLQWKRNNRAIADVIDELASGGMSAVLAQAKLEALGFAADRARAIVKDASDGRIDDEALLSTAEALAWEVSGVAGARRVTDEAASASASRPFGALVHEDKGPRDGDGDGMIYDGTDQEQPAMLSTASTGGGDAADALRREILAGGGLSTSRQSEPKTRDELEAIRNADVPDNSVAGDVRGNLVSRLELARSQPLEASKSSSGVEIVTFDDGFRMPIHRNPTADQAKAMLSNTKAGELRGLVDPANGDLFVWNAAQANHDQVAEVLGLDWSQITDSNGRKHFKSANQVDYFFNKDVGAGTQQSTATSQSSDSGERWLPTTAPEEFISARNKSTRAGFLSPLAPADIANHKLLLSKDGTHGAAVAPDGDIQNVFNNGGPKGSGAEAMIKAIGAGGNTLDCYDNFLPQYYAQFGFTEVGRMKFNPEFAPEGWDLEKDGQPDVVFMARTSTPSDQEMRDRASGKTERVKHERSTRYYEDWDAAKADSRAASAGKASGGLDRAENNRSGGDSANSPGGGADRGTVGRKVDSERIAAVRAGKEHSLDKYRTAEGKLDPKRRELWETIKSEFAPDDIATPTDRKPIMAMTGGGPASGKSTMLKSGAIKLPERHYKIDPDAIKERLPEYNDLRSAGDTKAAPFAHEESSEIGNELQLKAIERRVDSIIDGTGDGQYSKLKSRIERARSAGMSPVGYYASNDVELAVKLAAERGKKTGRYVPEDVVRGIHRTVSNVLPRLIEDDLFDELQLFDTNEKDNARPVVTKRRGQPLVIHNKQLWQDFLAKGKAGL